MKRLFALLLALVMIFTLTACDKDKEKELTAFELIDAATKKTEALDSVEIEMDVNMNMDMMGISMDVPLKYNIKGVGLTGNAPKMEMVMSASMFGMTIDVDAYVEDDYFYLSMMGEKMKTKAENAVDYDGMKQVSAMYGDLTEEMLRDTEVIKNEDGTKTVKLAMDSDSFKNAFKKLIDTTGSDAAEGSTIKEIAVSNANIEITVNADGYVDTYKVAFDMSMTLEMYGETSETSIKLDSTVHYKDPGKTVTVTAPAGYKDYPEVSGDEL